jgi:hypothetical protein
LKLKLVTSKSKNKVCSKEKSKVENFKVNTTLNYDTRNRNIHSSIGNPADPKSLIDKFFVTFKSREDNLDCKNNQKINGKLF